MPRHSTVRSRTAALALAALTGISSLVGAGTVVLAAGQADAAKPTYQPYGTTSAKDQRLRNGCHNYRYHYKITPPTDEWSAELFLVNPNKHTLANGSLDVASDPAEGNRNWYLCRNSTVSGRYTMKMKVTYNVAQDSQPRAAYVKPSHFRLTSTRGR